MTGRVTAKPLVPERERRWTFPALCGFGAVVLALVYAEPLQDGDLFWHMAYAEQMLDQGTLIPDHSIYSWMPASNRTIYCAWLAELALLGLWNLFGSAGLFVLRYLVVAGGLAFLWRYAWRLGVGRRPLTVLVLLVVGLSAKAGTIIKPELFSFLFFGGMVGAYFRARLAVRTGEDPRRWLAAVPLLLLVWVNTHGAFLLAAPFLARGPRRRTGQHPVLSRCRVAPTGAEMARRLLGGVPPRRQPHAVRSPVPAAVDRRLPPGSGRPAGHRLERRPPDDLGVVRARPPPRRVRAHHAGRCWSPCSSASSSDGEPHSTG